MTAAEAAGQLIQIIKRRRNNGESIQGKPCKNFYYGLPHLIIVHNVEANFSSFNALAKRK